MFTSRPIGYIRTPYRQRGEVPRGPENFRSTEGVIRLLPEYEAGLTDTEGFSHLCVLWEFDRSARFELSCIPPADNRPHGVFATRSSRRPNPIGLTVVELLRRDGPALYVRGVDMLDNTPVLDIKPYLSNVVEGSLRRGWLDEAGVRRGREAAA